MWVGARPPAGRTRYPLLDRCLTSYGGPVTTDPGTDPGADTGAETPTGPAGAGPGDVLVAVIGSGFAGIGMAAELRRRGIDDFLVFERAGDVGGTWRDNTYPGATCDVPSHLYSFSFAPNPRWTRSFSPQPEILDYLQTVAREHGVSSRCRFGAGLRHARWDGASARWQLDTAGGRFRSRFLIIATGALSEPAEPDIPGLADFEGATFHSARWNHDYDLRGKAVAVIGTGASAVQFVPRIADETGRLHVFQRTAPWVVPRRDRAFTARERWIYDHVPLARRTVRAGIYAAREGYVLGFAKNPRLTAPARRIAERHLRDQVADPRLRDRLRPDFAFGCKRVLITSDYYPTLQRPDVELVTEAISAVRPDAIVTADGARRPVDAIIFATGFRANDPPIASAVFDGAGRALADHWAGGMQALRGTTVAGFPNLFFIVGPNTGLGHTSMVYMIESQVAYISDAIRTVLSQGWAGLDVRPAAQTSYNSRLQFKLAGTVWNAGGCRSWYLDARGRNSTLWPDFTFRFRHETARVDLGEYRVIRDATV